MKSSHAMRGFLLLAVLTTGWGSAFADAANVKGDRVNVRAKASIQSEVITQLHKGETVSILEEIIPPAPVRGGSSNSWFKIAMPANTPVWVNSSHIDAASKTVSVRRLNVRGGAGENFSVLGTLEKGAAIKEIRTVGDWMEIEAPTNTFGFVSTEFVVRSSPPPPTPPAPAASQPVVEKLPVKEVDPAPVETVPRVHVSVPPTVAAQTAPKPPVEQPTPPPPLPVASTPVPPAPIATPVVPGATREEPLPRRTVSREGIVKRTFSIQAPGDHQLVSVDNGKTLNYLVTRKLGFSMEGFGGRKIVVTGEELVDKRWPNTPIIEVETFRIVP